MSQLLRNLPITRIKLVIAHVLYRIVHLASATDNKRIIRNGITFDVDLSEGIDLSLYLFGSFQSHVTEIKGFQTPANGVVIDVGANIGVMALNYAKQVPQGKVYAFEPTHYAYGKLKANLSLNPALAARIEVVHAFASSVDTDRPDIVAYSSWKIDGEHSESEHPVHGGTAQDASDVPAFTLDGFARNRELQRVDLIKIDTDGHELEVLQGAREILSSFRPVVIFEASLSLTEAREPGFRGYCDFFSDLGYTLCNSANLQPVTRDNFGSVIPVKGSIDILAVPTKSHKQAATNTQ